MAAGMRYSVLIIFCLMSLVSAGPISAACATDLGGGVESLTVAHSGSAEATDCDMGQKGGSQNKGHKCNHDACCGYQLIAIPEIREFLTPRPPRAAAFASVTKHLTGSGWEPLLDPPRA
jgi:hypothetical protein